MKTYYLIHRSTGMIYRLEGTVEAHSPANRWFHADGFALRLPGRFYVCESPKEALRCATVLLLGLSWTPMRANLKRKYNEKLDDIMRKEARQ